MSRVFFRAAVIWLGLAAIAIAAGILRTVLLVPVVGGPAAHVVGTLVVAAVFAAVILRAAPWIVPSLKRGRLLLLGAVWTAATIAFEFGFGHYVAGHSWEKLLADYNILRGRLWVLVLATLLLAPALAGRQRRARRED